MRFFQVVISGAALIAAALAVELNDVPTSISPGQTYTITYSPKDDTPTTLLLRKGVSTNLGTIGAITTSATGGSFQWTVPSDLVNGNDYALEIQQAGAAPNYSGQFSLTGGLASASASAYPTASVSASKSATVASSSEAASTTVVSTTVLSTTVLSTTVLSTTVLSTTVLSATITSASSLTTIVTSASGSIVPSAGTNSTVTSATLSGSPSSTATSGPPESTGAASSIGSSPLALLFGAVAAIAYLN